MDDNVDQDLEALLGKADIVLISAVGQIFQKRSNILAITRARASVVTGVRREHQLDASVHVQALGDAVSRTVTEVLHRGGGLIRDSADTTSGTELFQSISKYTRHHIKRVRTEGQTCSLPQRCR